jgi:hypothetical protein
MGREPANHCQMLSKNVTQFTGISSHSILNFILASCGGFAAVLQRRCVCFAIPQGYGLGVLAALAV